MIPIFSCQDNGKADCPIISEHTDIQPLHHKLWYTLFSEVGQCSFTVLRKVFFLPWFFDTIQCIDMKIANYHDKQLSPSETRGQDRFFSLDLWYLQIEIVRLEFLQSCGTQIMVNTLTSTPSHKYTYLVKLNFFMY